jgi:sugar phosphate isomerase/epimerase
MERRRFLRTTVLAAAGGTLSAAVSAPAQDRGGCGLAIGTYGLQSMPLDEAIRLIAATGYNAFEITALPGTTGAPSVLKSADERSRLRDLIAESGLRLCGIMAGLEPQSDEVKHQAQLEELYALIQLGHDLSPDRAPVIQTVLGGKKWESSRELFRDRIANWVQLNGDLRGSLSIKPHRSHAMSVPSEAGWLIGQLGTPERLGMVYDYSHYAFHEPPLSIAETVASSLPLTNYVAVKDAVMTDGAVRFALAGESDSWDHADIISAFHDGGYRGDFCCEVSSQIWKSDPGYDPVKVTKLCYENMAAAFERAGVARR